MLSDRKKIILVMNRKRRNFNTETEILKKIQMKILEYKHCNKNSNKIKYIIAYICAIIYINI